MGKSSKKTLASTRKIVKNEEAKPKLQQKKTRKALALKMKSLAQDQQKLKGAILIFVGSLMLIFVGIFLVNRILRAQPIAEMLPADTTVGFVELNIDGNSAQPRQFFEIFKKYPVWQKNGLVQLLNALLPVDFEKDLKPWLGRKAAVAFMQDQSQQGRLNLLLFLENKDAHRAMDFFANRTLKNTGDQLVAENYNGTNIYSYKVSQDYYFAFLQSYLVLAGSSDLLHQLVDFANQKKPTPALRDELNYRKIADNLPQNGLGFGYINTPKFFDALLKNPSFSGQRGHQLLMFQPFLNLFSAEGFSLAANDHRLFLQTFSAINRAELKGAAYLTYSEKYEGRLLALAGESPILLAAGHNLYKELNRLQEIFSSGTKTSGLVFQGFLEALKEKYLGKDIVLEDDLYPLLKNEYLLTVDQSFASPQVAVFLELNDKNADLLRIEKIVRSFVKISGILNPRIQEVTLPDGTKGNEVVASNAEMTRSDEVYDGINLTALKLGDLPWGINYAIVDNTLIASTSLQNLKNSIDRKMNSSLKNLKASELYKNAFRPLSASADEMMHLKIGALTDFFGLGKDNLYGPYLEPFLSVTGAKNFFDDGISTVYSIDIL